VRKGQTLMVAMALISLMMINCGSDKAGQTTKAGSKKEVLGKHLGESAKTTSTTGHAIDLISNGKLAGADALNDKEWLVSSDETITLEYEWDEAVTVSSVKFRLLSDYLEKVYPPLSIDLKMSRDGVKYTTGSNITRFRTSDRVIEEELKVKPKAIKKLKIDIKPYQTIKSGLPGEGTLAKLFLDEIEIR